MKNLTIILIMKSKMWQNKKFLQGFVWILLVALLLVNFVHYFSNVRCSRYSLDPLSHVPYKYTKAKPILFIHDVSPKYFSALKEIISVTNAHHFQHRTYLFLIVNHHNIYNMKNYPKYVAYLKMLQKEGYHIEYHALLHNGAEFLCPGKVAKEKLEKSFRILKACGFDTAKIRYFIPPEGKLSHSAEEVFLKKGFKVILPGFILYKRNGKVLRKRISYREYTWYLKEKDLKKVELKALIDYYDVPHHQYCLSVHPVAVNTKAGMAFLNFALRFGFSIKTVFK